MRSKHIDIPTYSKTLKPDVRLPDVLNCFEDEILIVDSEYRVLFANTTVLSKYPKAGSRLGKFCYGVLQNRNKPCSSASWECPLRQVLRSSQRTTVIDNIPVRGNDTYLKITAYPLHDSDGIAYAMVEMRRDVTAERALEANILRRHHQLLALSHISSTVSGLRDLDAILRITLDNVLDLFDGTIGGILLLDEKSKTLYYRTYSGLSPQYAENMRMKMGEGIAGHVAQTGQSVLVDDVSKDPRAVRSDLVSAEGIKGFVSIPLKSKEKVVGVMNIISHLAERFGADDISLLNSIGDYLGTTIEQAKLYERLARVGERYKTLLRHSLTAQEQERKRIARDLHDETAQALTSMTLSLQAIIITAEMRDFGDAIFIEKLKKIHSNAVHAGNEVVRIMKELRPSLLDELGLPAAIHRYAMDKLQDQGIDVTDEFVGTDQRFRPEVEVELYRFAQGAIGNILEHSKAKNAYIQLECNDTECVLTIQDDGKGFDISKLTRVEPGGRGAGLFTMRERTSLLGGAGYVESKPGKGTKITAKIPLTTDVEKLTREAIDADDKSADS
ncbi:GAF domain-containing protein [Chloroflexota bacterium]